MVRKSGATVMETILACSLLAATAVSMSVMSLRMQRGYRQRALIQQAWVEVCNARQLIGTWKPDDLQLEKIQSLPISERLRRECPEIQWVARVEGIQQPLAGQRVYVGLRWKRDEQETAPLGIAFWHASDPSVKESP